jgi:endonuclease III
MIKITTNKSLNIVLPNTNRALKEVLDTATPKELEQLSQGKDLKSVLDSLLKQSSTDNSSDKLLLNLVKNNPTLKSLSNVTPTLKELQSSLQKEQTQTSLTQKVQSFLEGVQDIDEKGLQSKLKDSGVFLESKIKNLQTPQQELKTLLSDLSKVLDSSNLSTVKGVSSDIKQLLESDLFKGVSKNEILQSEKTQTPLLEKTAQEVKKVIANISQRLDSNVDKTLQPNDVLYTKDTKALIDKLPLYSKQEQLQPQLQTKELFSNDMKALLLKTQDELTNSTSTPNKQEILKQVDKLLLQIDYHQLVSQLSNATSLYIPYSWDALEDGNITIKNQKDGRFFTDINLTLKDFGELKLRLGLFENKQLNINLSTKSQELKSLLQESIPTLRKQLSSVGIEPKEIRFLEDKRSNYDEATHTLDVGFEVKG